MMRWLESLEIQAEEVECRTAGEEAEVIKCQPDLLPVPPLPEGPRQWGVFHLAGYWIAEAFGELSSTHRVLAPLIPAH